MSLKEATQDSDIERGLARLNALPHESATAALLDCCGSRRWAQAMSVRRPFGDVQELTSNAERIWWSLDAEDWLEAFRSHPKIGERKSEGAASLSHQWSEGEQSGARDASREITDALAEANRAYEKRFGFIFIVCATGKSAAEMLALLRQRFDNDAETELRVAAEEQRRITQLRLQKLLDT